MACLSGNGMLKWAAQMFSLERVFFRLNGIFNVKELCFADATQ